MLSNIRDLPYGVLKAILERYDNHILFRLFVYPYIERNTLLKIDDSFVFSLLCGYLNDCCKQIHDMFSSIDKTYNSKYKLDILQINPAFGIIYLEWSMIQMHYVLS